MAKVRIEGVREVQERIRKANGDVDGATSAAIYQMALRIDAEAVKRVPVDTGRLRSTHYASPPMSFGIQKKVSEVGFGTDYAVPVHERTDVHHPVGEAKFLEKAVNKFRGNWESTMARMIWSNFEKGITVRSVNGSAPKSPSE